MDNLSFNQNNKIENVNLAQLNKGGIKKTDLDSEYQSIFNPYDKDKNNVLDKGEMADLILNLKKVAQRENQQGEEATIMDEAEAKTFLAQNGIDNPEYADVLEFVKSLVRANSKVSSFKEEDEGDDGKTAIIEYENGDVITRVSNQEDEGYSETFEKDNSTIVSEYNAQGKKTN